MNTITLVLNISIVKANRYTKELQVEYIEKTYKITEYKLLKNTLVLTLLNGEVLYI